MLRSNAAVRLCEDYIATDMRYHEELAEFELREEGEPVFNDVAIGTGTDRAVYWLSKAGIVNGTGGGSFRPMDFATREQLIAMLCRIARNAGIDTSSTADISEYKDADEVSPWAKEAMAWAVGAGYAENEASLCPKERVYPEDYKDICGLL